jgi:hypothetical protein
VKKLLAFFLLLFLAVNVYAVSFTFSMYSSMEFNHDFVHGASGTGLTTVILDFWEEALKFGFCVGTTTLESSSYWATNHSYRFSFLPLELYYRPFRFGRFFYASTYTRLSWQFENSQNDVFFNPRASGTTNFFHGAFGGRLEVIFMERDGIPLSDDLRLRYQLRAALFAEYTTRNEFRVGIAFDGLIGALASFLTSGGIVPVSQ